MASPKRQEQGAPTGIGMASREWELARKQAHLAECAEALAGETSGRMLAAHLRAADTHRRAGTLHERIAALHLSFHLMQGRRAGPPATGFLAGTAEGDLRL